MNNEQRMVRDFHIAFNPHLSSDTPTLQAETTDELRVGLIQEELDELTYALGEGDLVQVADALGDLLYVVYGAAVTYGIDMEPVFAEVHRSNMSKVNPETGKPEYRPDGKVLKGPWYSPPNLRPILEAQAS